MTSEERARALWMRLDDDDEQRAVASILAFARQEREAALEEAAAKLEAEYRMFGAEAAEKVRDIRLLAEAAFVVTKSEADALLSECEKALEPKALTEEQRALLDDLCSCDYTDGYKKGRKEALEADALLSECEKALEKISTAQWRTGDVLALLAKLKERKP